MKNVPWISTADFREHLAQKPALHEREQQLQGILERVHVPRPALAGADELAAGISAMAQGLARLLPETISGRDELTDICYRFNQTLQQFQGAKVSAVRLIGGTLKHFNFVMYSHGYALEGEAEVVALYRSWRKQLLDFMRDAARHTQRVLKQRPWGDLSDPWLALSLVQNEMEAIDGRRKKNQKTATAQ